MRKKATILLLAAALSLSATGCGILPSLFSAALKADDGNDEETSYAETILTANTAETTIAETTVTTTNTTTTTTVTTTTTTVTTTTTEETTVLETEETLESDPGDEEDITIITDLPQTITSSEEEDFAGVWLCQYLATEDGAITLADLIEFYGEEVGITMTVYDDGYFLLDEFTGEDITTSYGSWTVEGDTAVFTSDGESIDAFISYEYLVLVVEDLDVRYYFTKVE